jgi:hypothetical protein
VETIPNDIKKDHPFSYKGVFYSYDWHEIKTSYPFWISLIVSLILFIISKIASKDSFNLATFWVGQSLTIFPSLLGFNLGGYALIIGFGNSDLVQSLTKKAKNKKTSIFQKLSGVFAFAILLQLLAFSLAFIGNYSIQLKLDFLNQKMSDFINNCYILVLSFITLWGIFILLSLVVNVFNFGQMHHFKLTQKRLLEEEKTTY